MAKARVTKKNDPRNNQILLQGFTKDYLASLFEYHSDTGMFVRKIGRKGRGSKRGAIVGNEDGKGYLHVCVDYTFIRLHRLAYFLVYGETPYQIDHIDRDKKNNSIANLRPANQRQNNGNVFQKNNTSGYKGVSKNSRSGKWYAQIKLNGVQTYLGRFDNKIDAARRYNEAAFEHFGEHAWLNDV